MKLLLAPKSNVPTIILLAGFIDGAIGSLLKHEANAFILFLLALNNADPDHWNGGGIHPKVMKAVKIILNWTLIPFLFVDWINWFLLGL